MRYLVEEQLEEAEASLKQWRKQKRTASRNIRWLEGSVMALNEALKRYDDEHAQEGDDLSE